MRFHLPQLFSTAILVLMLAVRALAGEDQPKQTPPPKPASQATSDKDGKKKTLVQTPFGVSVRRAEGNPEPAKPSSQPSMDDRFLRIEEKGDTIVFRRQTPFGDQVWQRNRSELTQAERDLIEAHATKEAGRAREKGAVQGEPPVDAKKNQ